MRHRSYSVFVKPAALAAAALGATLTGLFGTPAFAQDAAPAAPAPPATTANGPGPATQPPPPPGTTTPAPTQPPAAPTPPGTASPGAAAPAAPAAPAPPNYGVQTSGLIDAYYQYAFNNPPGTLIQGTGRSYDQRIKTPALALAELNVFANPKPGGFGFKTTLIAGDTADINHANFNSSNGTSIQSTGEAQFKNIQQLYGTYSFGAKGGGIDVGKFYTPFGYEVTEANGNYNYSRSLPYFLLPIYHAGARIYTPSINGLVVTGYVVNAIFNTADEGVHRRGDAGYIGQINFTDPNGKFTAIGTLGYGKNKPIDVKIANTVGDADFTYNINANQLIGLNYTYVKADPEDMTPTTTDNGYAVYYRQALTPKTAVAARFSGFQAKTDATSDTPESTFRPYEFTLTYEMKPTSAFTTRLEYRHDNANSEVFLSHSGDVDKKSQDTLTLAGMFTF